MREKVLEGLHRLETEWYECSKEMYSTFPCIVLPKRQKLDEMFDKITQRFILLVLDFERKYEYGATYLHEQELLRRLKELVSDLGIYTSVLTETFTNYHVKKAQEILGRLDSLTIKLENFASEYEKEVNARHQTITYMC